MNHDSRQVGRVSNVLNYDSSDECDFYEVYHKMSESELTKLKNFQNNINYVCGFNSENFKILIILIRQVG